MLRMVTSLLGSSPAFLIRWTRTSAGVEPLPAVTIVLPFKSAMVKLGIGVLERINPPSPLVSCAKFTSRRSGLASCVSPAASGPHERDIGIAAHHFRERGLHAPGGLRAHDLKPFLLERAAPQRDILRRIEQAAQDLVELDLLRCRWLRRQEPCERGGEHGDPTKATRPRIERICLLLIWGQPRRQASSVIGYMSIVGMHSRRGRAACRTAIPAASGRGLIEADTPPADTC